MSPSKKIPLEDCEYNLEQFEELESRERSRVARHHGSTVALLRAYLTNQEKSNDDESNSESEEDESQENDKRDQGSGEDKDGGEVR